MRNQSEWRWWGALKPSWVSSGGCGSVGQPCQGEPVGVAVLGGTEVELGGQQGM